jgi:cell division protein FtsL
LSIIVTTKLHNAEKKILDLKEEIKEQNRQNGDVSELAKKLLQEKQELENQQRKSYLNLPNI